ncbi:MAG: His-Xaa-Ser system radical SAM maturase HxsB [Elusimicrobia bacterium]|nr:His-Xaa-Ser system radical SAM maturase HxsB [Elusimicrobiota bacterium]
MRPGEELLRGFSGESAGLVRFRQVGPRYLLTNEFGRHVFLEAAEFSGFMGGRLDKESALYERLCAEGFVRDRMDFAALAQRWRKRHSFLWQGPGLHIVVVTLRCNHRCLYCQASSVGMKEAGTDMSLETARMAVDRIFESPNPALTIEFQGGEPLANWPAVEFITNYARQKNEAAGKKLWINLVSNLSLMDEAKLDFLLANGVTFCTSLDGPADLHDRNRPYAGGASHAEAVRWFKEIQRRTARQTFGIDALLTTTRFSLGRAKDIVDEYVRLGARSVYLRPLNPYGLAKATWEKIGYSVEEFLRFYKEALDYILEINSRQVFFEQWSRLFLAKILTDEDPNFLDLRSPCGAGIGQIAYNYDGRIYTCDEGRMLSRMGDESFQIGTLAGQSYADTVSHPVVKALSVASCLENNPDCDRCAYKPYCGLCPIQCYAEQGDIVGRMPLNARCRLHQGILDLLFDKLDDPRCRKTFELWLRKPEILYQR